MCRLVGRVVERCSSDCIRKYFEKVVVVNPTAVSNDEKQSIITAFMNKNQNIRGYLASTDPVTVDNNGNVTLHYRDGSSTTLDATNVMTYEPVVKSEYQTAEMLLKQQR